MDRTYDAIIVGGGPAGLSAAIYLARAQYRVLVMEKEKMGGQITITSEVVNYPGVPVTSGKKLTEGMRQQGERFGAEFLMTEVKALELEGDWKVVHTDKGEYKALSVLLATGSSPRKLGFPGEKEFQGRGVAYCATCDGEFFTGKQVFVIGGGFAAAEEAVFLTRYASHVTVIVREEDFTCDGAVADGARNHPDIDIHYETELIEAGGQGKLQYAVFRNNADNSTWRYDAQDGDTFGIFVFAGYVPAVELFEGQVELSQTRNLVTDRDQKTSLDGVYGAGDVCVKPLRQVVTAVSDGALAATAMEKWISSQYTALKLPEREKPVPKKPLVESPSLQENSEEESGWISSAMKAQLDAVFGKFQSNVLLKLYKDSSKLSDEIESFVQEVAALTDKIQVETLPLTGDSFEGSGPLIAVCSEDGSWRGTSFHGVPGGHEFNSFVIALYNAAGPGQPLAPETLAQIREVEKDVHLQVMVSLSCTMCPELVMAAQRLALENRHITTQVYDLAHYPQLKEKYDIMSVPCLVMNDGETISFGKKNIEEILELISS